MHTKTMISVADPDPGVRCFETWIRDENPGSYFRELRTQFLGKNT
jgi:hypothetical protein